MIEPQAWRGVKFKVKHRRRPRVACARRAGLWAWLVLAALSGGPAAATDRVYSREERFAGCLFGDTVPLLRRGYSRDRALSIASVKCEALSVGMTEHEIADVSDYVNASIDALER